MHMELGQLQHLNRPSAAMLRDCLTAAGTLVYGSQPFKAFGGQYRASGNQLYMLHLGAGHREPREC